MFESETKLSVDYRDSLEQPRRVVTYAALFFADKE